MNKILEYIKSQGLLGREVDLLLLIRKIDATEDELASEICNLYRENEITLNLNSGYLYTILRKLDDNISLWGNPDKFMLSNLRSVYAQGIKKKEIEKIIKIMLTVREKFWRVHLTYTYLRTSLDKHRKRST